MRLGPTGPLAALMLCASAWAQTPTAPVRGPAPAAAAPTATAPAAAASAAVAPGAAAPNAAAAPAYRIELIVFRAASSLGGPEDWSAEAGAEAAAGAAASGDADVSSPAQPSTVAPASPQSALVRTLPPAEFQLNALEARLRSSGAYVPLAHAAWLQSASPWGTREGIPLQRLGLDAAGLSGSVALERGQFLHLDLALDYADAQPPAALGAPPGTVFTLRQSQRVRFYERNYFDHPAFGVIALVTPAQGGRRPGR